MDNKTFISEEQQRSMVSLYAFIRFDHGCSFRLKVDMDLGYTSVSFNTYPDDLMALSYEELQKRIDSIEKPWWYDMYEDVKDDKKILIIIAKRGYSLEDLEMLHKLWEKADFEKIETMYEVSVKRSKYLPLNLRSTHLFLDYISSLRNKNLKEIIMSLKKCIVKGRMKDDSTYRDTTASDTKEYYESQYQNILELCKDKDLSKPYIESLFRHFYYKYINSQSKDVKLVIDKIFHVLYNYSIEKSIIASDISYEDFHNGKGLYDDMYTINKLIKETHRLK